MKTPVTFWRWMRSFGQQQAVKQEIDEELRFHIEQRTGESPLAFVSTIGALSLVTLLACWLPARRATKVQRMEALRGE